MYSEDDLQPISALQHLAFCERQWGLIHLEKVWTENVLTAQGRQLHERTHEPDTEIRGDLRIARGLRLRSLRLGLSGQADVVEFRKVESPEGDAAKEDLSPPECIPLPDAGGLWRVFPVEYKHGRPKQEPWDEYQLCAQAMCLEEMLGAAIPSGALFYGKTRHRHDVDFTPALRAATEALTARLHALILAGRTPAARYEKKCESCSLVDPCLPRMAEGRRSARQYLDDILEGD